MGATPLGHFFLSNTPLAIRAAVLAVGQPA
jgi:hypothetical protein